MNYNELYSEQPFIQHIVHNDYTMQRRKILFDCLLDLSLKMSSVNKEQLFLIEFGCNKGTYVSCVTFYMKPCRTKLANGLQVGYIMFILAM